jgi:hypothetical protein
MSNQNGRKFTYSDSLPSFLDSHIDHESSVDHCVVTDIIVNDSNHFLLGCDAMYDGIGY